MRAGFKRAGFKRAVSAAQQKPRIAAVQYGNKAGCQVFTAGCTADFFYDWGREGLKEERSYLLRSVWLCCQVKRLRDRAFRHHGVWRAKAAVTDRLPWSPPTEAENLELINGLPASRCVQTCWPSIGCMTTPAYHITPDMQGQTCYFLNPPNLLAWTFFK